MSGSHSDENKNMDEFSRMQDDYACHRTLCLRCNEYIAQDDLGEWFDTEGDRTCPVSPTGFHEPTPEEG